MTYVNAVKYIYSLPKADANLERAHRVYELISSADDRVKTIHIFGKQGKNSCHRMLSSILSQSGLTVGGFSPSHATEPREAITVNGKPISYEIFAESVAELKRIYFDNSDLGEPSRDELIFLTAMISFRKAGCDVAILEKGLKKNDAANVTEAPILYVVASMGDIPAEELDLAEILRRGTSETVTSPQHKDVYNAISQSCARIGSRLTLSIYSELEISKINLFKTSFFYEGTEYSIRSFSPYQTVNAITVIEAANALVRLGISISSQNIRDGIEKATFPNKCEAITLEPTIIVRSADTEASLPSLAASIAQVSEHINGDIVVAVDNDCSFDAKKIRAVFSAYGVSVKGIVSISSDLTPSKLTKSIRELIDPIVSDEAMSSALVLIAGEDFAAKLSDTVRQILGRT